MKTIELGVYQHYKGNLYRVTQLVRHADTEEFYVVYQLLYKDYSFWTRTLDDFLEKVYVDGQAVARFQLVDPVDSK